MSDNDKAIRIVAATTPYKPPIGDIDVYGLDGWLTPAPRKLVKESSGRYLKRSDGLKVLPLGYVRSHPFKACVSLGIDLAAMKERAEYKCPVMGQRYYAFVPCAIMTEDLERYLSRGQWRPWVPDMVRDQPFVTEDLYFDEPNLYAALLIGTGYTDWIMPHDGGNEVKINALLLDNGDRLLVWHFEWFNK